MAPPWVCSYCEFLQCHGGSWVYTLGPMGLAIGRQKQKIEWSEYLQHLSSWLQPSRLLQLLPQEAQSSPRFSYNPRYSGSREPSLLFPLEAQGVKHSTGFFNGQGLHHPLLVSLNPASILYMAIWLDIQLLCLSIPFIACWVPDWPSVVLDTGNNADKNKVHALMDPKVKSWRQTVSKEAGRQII